MCLYESFWVLIPISLEVCSKRSDEQESIIWTNSGLVYWCICICIIQPQWVHTFNMRSAMRFFVLEVAILKNILWSLDVEPEIIEFAFDYDLVLAVLKINTSRYRKSHLRWSQDYVISIMRPLLIKLAPLYYNRPQVSEHIKTQYW